MATDQRGSKTDAMVKLILVFVMFLLSFTVGTYVGKKFSDSQHKIAQLEPNSADGKESRDISSIPSEETKLKSKNSLSDEEIKKLAEEFVTENEETPEPDPHSKKDTHDPNSHSVVNEAAHRVIEGKSPKPEEEESPPQEKPKKPQKLPTELATSTIGKYTIQVASFINEPSAQKMTIQLKEKGFSAFYVSAKVRDKIRFRVSVGLFTTQKEAEVHKVSLLARAKLSSALVQKIGAQ